MFCFAAWWVIVHDIQHLKLDATKLVVAIPQRAAVENKHERVCVDCKSRDEQTGWTEISDFHFCPSFK